MAMIAPEWHEPRSLDEALSLRAEHGEEATVVAGGSFLGIVMNQRLFAPTMLVALRSVPDLDYIGADGGPLRLGAMTTHRVVARSVRGEREIPMDVFVLDHYETALEEDELVTELRIPRSEGRSIYRKFSSRSSEDRPCVSVAAAQEDGGLRVVVGAVAGRPQYFPEICDLAKGELLSGEVPTEIGRRYAEEIEPLSDSRGSARYRRRVIAVEVRRALEDLNHD